jgi:hypothetical protein
LTADDLEVAVLSRMNGRRCFQRLSDAQVADILAAAPPPPPAAEPPTDPNTTSPS